MLAGSSVRKLVKETLPALSRQPDCLRLTETELGVWVSNEAPHYIHLDALRTAAVVRSPDLNAFNEEPDALRQS
jgi:hypothetical protein